MCASAMKPASASPLAALLGLILLPAPAAALQSDRQQPMQIGADYSDATLGETGKALLRGNVSIVQGSLKIDSETATVERTAGEIRRAQLEGSPVRLEQALDAGGKMQARARGVDYDLVNEVLLLTGDVVVTQPEGELRGERIRYDMKTGRLEGGGDGGGRVQMRIEPRVAKPAPPSG